MINNILEGVWPEWQITKELGRGTYGIVYEAVCKEHQVERYAAIKVISIPMNKSEIDSLRSEGLTEDATRTYLQGIVNEFESEIQLMGSFKGIKNIVNVEDYKIIEKKNEIGWNIYIRMELLTSFNTYVSDKTLSEKDVIKLGCDICTALELYAKHNMIHCDIKPENIFVNSFGDFKLGDAGIARKLESVTSVFAQKGTYHYMAPEVEYRNDYDATVDLYSLGLVLYRFTNKNRLPFLDTEQQLLSPNERMAAARKRLDGAKLPAPCEATHEMAEVILCACEPNPNDRFVSATAMKRALLNVYDEIYNVDGDELNGIISVHESSKENHDKEISIYKVPEENLNSSSETDISGEKKNLNILKIIAIISAVALIIGSAGLVASKLASNQEEMKESATEETTEAVTKQSEYDEGQVESIIDSAEDFASKGNYESAITAIDTGLLTYPDSERLLDKKKSYCTEYKNASIKEADNFVMSGQYSFAINKMEEVATVIGDDAEIKQKIQQYKKAQEESEAYIAEQKMTASQENTASQVSTSPFYGIWCNASKDFTEAQNSADSLSKQGFDAKVFVTTDWSNLNSEKWYVVSAGVYSSKANAKAALSSVRAVYSSAYVKYSGEYQGSSSSFEIQSNVQQNNSSHPAFYGIWCNASKSFSEAQKAADNFSQKGFDAQVFVTSDWSNLNSEKWYVVTTGVYFSKEEAKAALSGVQAVYPDAYIKYSGNWQG